jgi:hypothetical protein
VITPENSHSFSRLRLEFGASGFGAFGEGNVLALNEIFGRVADVEGSVLDQAQVCEVTVRDLGRCLSEFSSRQISGACQVLSGRREALEGRLSELKGIVKSGQLYREGQEMIWGEHSIEKDCLSGLSHLRESARLGHCGASLGCGLYFEAGKICQRDVGEAARFFPSAAREGHPFGQS